MAGVLIENRGVLPGILRQLGAEHWDCNWLLTGLEVVDREDGHDWEEPVFLSHAELLRDAERVQFIWGILSAVPAGYPREQVLEHPLPAFFEDENGESCYLADVLRPQHPLAFLEIVSEDSSSVTVIAEDRALLEPLFRLPEWTEDAEASNRRWHETVRQGEAALAALGLSRWQYRTCPGVPQRIRNDRLAAVWRRLYHRQPEKLICVEDIRAELIHPSESERKNEHA